MNIFITGGTGCLGIQLIKRLLNRGNDIYALVRAPSDANVFDNNDRLRFIRGDMLNPSDFGAKMENIEIDVVIHCAAIMDTSKSKTGGSRSDCQDNVAGTKNMAEFAKKKKVKQFIHISSCSVMGDIYNGKRDETFDCFPDSKYGRSKYDCETILNKYCKDANLPITILRLGLMYGPFDRGAMKRIIELIDKDRFVLPGDGENKKSVVCVHNVVKAIICVLNNPNAINEMFIVTDGRDYTLNEIVKEIAVLLGHNPRFFRIHNKLSILIGHLIDVFNAVFSASLPLSSREIKKFISNNTYIINKITNKVNYSPEVSLTEGLAEEIAWYKRTKQI